MKRIIFLGCIAVFVMFFLFLFVSEKLLCISNELERNCAIELYTTGDDFGIKQTGCQAAVLMAKSISMLFTLFVMAAIGGICYLMFKHYVAANIGG